MRGVFTLLFGVLVLAPVSVFASTKDGPAIPLHWLEGQPNSSMSGTTWGMPWAKGTVEGGDEFQLNKKSGETVALQSWPLAYWPDGSLKWTAHAIGADVQPGESYTLVKAKSHTAIVEAETPDLAVEDSPDEVVVENGLMTCRFKKTGPYVIDSMTCKGKDTVKNGRLIAMSRNTPEFEESWHQQTFLSEIEQVTVEQSGPVRAVVKVEGIHQNEDRKWLPFVLRFYFYAGTQTVRVMHSFVYDGEDSIDFISGLGVRFEVTMGDELYDRHVRLVGEGHGLFAEAIQGITGLRRDPGEAVRKAQVDGRKTPPLDQWDSRVSNRFAYIPAWGDFTLSQLSSDGFHIRKRTKEGHAWVSCDTGNRSSGIGYIGGATTGGVSFGMRDFWHSHPSQLDIRHAQTDTAEVTMWFWSPEAQPMDMRFYHDGMGMDTYPKQIEGLNITYEDYEDGYGSAHGIARTTEFYIRPEAFTPSREDLVAFADRVKLPAQLAVSPEVLLASAVFGAQWSLPDRSTPFKQWLEDRLAYKLDAYVNEVDQRSWYGFWNFGDVMHSYDRDRHVWRYDVGGYAWDNAELSPPLWLWMSYFRTGRSDVFRLAEAMCRHNAEVDFYHLGRFKGLGTRHGVQHWGDSSKQTRVSTASYYRHYYYLTADERMGDILSETLFGIEAEKKINVGRKQGDDPNPLPLPAYEDPEPGGSVQIGGMKFGNMMASWITEAERTNDPKWHRRIVNAMQGMTQLPYGFWAGAMLDIESGRITEVEGSKPKQSHLRCCFGLPEICVELIETYGDEVPGFAEVWAHYGRFYNAKPEVRMAELGPKMSRGNLQDSHSRCTAYAALHDSDQVMAERAWSELLGRFQRGRSSAIPVPVKLEGPVVLNPIDELVMGTNGSQWEMAAIECLKFIGEYAPNELENPE